jgi:anaerobic ribonucleoside-triphosphate reductase activating protein
MNYLDIKHCNMVNGEGLRTVIWVAGCDRKCPGCFSPYTHDPNGGVPFDENAKEALFLDSNENWCSGITFCGGDPLYCGNRETVISVAREYKERFPNKTIWLYTGYCWSEILEDHTMTDIIKYADVICDGPFVESLKDASLKWVGSSNQHVIDVKQRLKQISEISREV